MSEHCRHGYSKAQLEEEYCRPCANAKHYAKGRADERARIAGHVRDQLPPGYKKTLLLSLIMDDGAHTKGGEWRK